MPSHMAQRRAAVFCRSVLSPCPAAGLVPGPCRCMGGAASWWSPPRPVRSYCTYPLAHRQLSKNRGGQFGPDRGRELGQHGRGQRGQYRGRELGQDRGLAGNAVAAAGYPGTAPGTRPCPPAEPRPLRALDPAHQAPRPGPSTAHLPPAPARLPPAPWRTMMVDRTGRLGESTENRSNSSVVHSAPH